MSPMRVRRSRFLPIIAAAILFAIFVCGYITGPGDQGWINSINTLNSVQYLKDKVHDEFHGTPKDTWEWDGVVGDKVIVIARTEAEDASWVEQKLPDWQRAIYTVPNKTSTTSFSSSPASLSSTPLDLALPVNKGNEALAYLTYIIDFYQALPSTILFLHAHENGYSKAWHVDARLHSNVLATRSLRLETVAERGYASMRCNPYSTCMRRPGYRHPWFLSPQVFEEFWANTSTPASAIKLILKERTPIDEADPHSPLGAVEASDEPYPPLAMPHAAQFAVSKEAVHKRPREDYIALREWLLATDLTDYDSGMVFEFQWHVLFGMPGVMCYDRSKCDCDVFGRC